MKEQLLDWNLNQNLKYNDSNDYQLKLEIKGLTIKNGVKNWNFACTSPEILALFSNEEDNLNNILKAIAGIDNIFSGNIILNNQDATYNILGWERQISYLPNQQQNWNKLFSLKYNLFKIAKKNKSYLQAISNHNIKIKTTIANLKNTGLNLNTEEFKNKIITLIKEFINETQKSRNSLIKEYETTTNHFHQEYAKENFNFPGSSELAAILVRKFNAEEENIIVNNDLIFYQSLQDRISSLESLTGECFCGCKPPKMRKKEFRLKEIPYIIAEINNYLDEKIFETRKAIRTTLKSCNNHNQIFSNELNQALLFKTIKISRAEIDQIIDAWVDLAETQRVQFNMKQDFIAMQLLPDEMQLLLQRIQEQIKIYHNKLLTDQKFSSQEVYDQKLKTLEDSLIDANDLINDNILKIFQTINETEVLTRGFTQLSFLERRFANIAQKLVVPTKILLLENPFQLLEQEDKKKLATWLKVLSLKLRIVIIFSSKENQDINLLASNICVIENQVVIQQGKTKEMASKPLSLNLLKEMNKQQVNVFKGHWEKPELFFYDRKIGSFPNLLETPIVALKFNDVAFSYKKPFFTAFRKLITINGEVKNITKFNDKYSILSFQAFDNTLFQVFVDNNAFKIGTKGWLSIVKNTIYIFDPKTNHLIGTW
ncbi:hypothetical protein LT336_00409 [Spiroplasma sp. JKS002671]|uniref:hypothetical protein n=1 Tax=Spiroplasma attinicola TaxID=2904537 RepID=UPI002022AEED|nr:hypothetical protein [Spiroplasma sp. JKS002671]MCL8210665.1 hypothetical protein [Spiroplasma sp. JKS002671]